MGDIETLRGILEKFGDSRHLFKLGIKGLGLGAVLIPFSFVVPMFGILGALVFSDLILLSIGLLLVAIMPLSARGRLVTVVVLWGVASTAIEITRLSAYQPDAGLYQPNVKVFRQASIQAGSTITIAGDANPLTYAEGPNGFVSMDLHQVGVRYSWGIPLLNRVHISDVPDLLWERGYIPNIDGTDQYRVLITNTISPPWRFLSVAITDASGDILAQFRRTLPLPLEAPGVRLPDYKLLLYSIFQDNLLRAMLNLNGSVKLTEELHDFFDQVFGVTHSRHVAKGNFSKLVVISDEVYPLSQNTRFDMVFKNIGSGAESHKDTISVCGLAFANKRFGSISEGLSVYTLPSATRIFPVILKANLNTNQDIDYYCHEESGDFWIFSRHGDVGQSTRISRHRRDGIITGLYYVQMPVSLHNKSVINKGSLQVTRNELKSFSLSTPVVLSDSPNLILSQTSYRVLNMARVP